MAGWVVVFAHGSSGGRPNSRNRLDARTLHQSGLATLLLDLLTTEELDRTNVVDIGLLAGRLMAVTRWLQAQPEVRGLPVGFFGAGMGLRSPCGPRRRW